MDEQRQQPLDLQILRSNEYPTQFSARSRQSDLNPDRHRGRRFELRRKNDKLNRYWKKDRDAADDCRSSLGRSAAEAQRCSAFQDDY